MCADNAHQSGLGQFPQFGIGVGRRSPRTLVYDSSDNRIRDIKKTLNGV